MQESLHLLEPPPRHELIEDVRTLLRINIAYPMYMWSTDLAE